MKANKTLLMQVLFAAIAFIVMVLLSYAFISGTVRRNLVRNADSMLDYAQERVEDTLSAFESAFASYAGEAHSMVLEGATAEELGGYVKSISHYSFLDGKITSGIQNFFGYFETLPGGPVFLYDDEWTMPAGYRPQDQSWYEMAVAAGDGVVQTTPIIQNASKTVFTYAQCLMDEKGNRLGIVGMTASIDLLGRNIVETTFNQGGYGMLISQDGTVLFHPNGEFRGIDITDPAIPISQFAEEIENNQKILEQPLTSYRDEPAIVFFRMLNNGWHLGLVTPEDQYYRSIYSMGWTLALMGGILAAILIGILIRLDAARVKSDEESKQKSVFLANMSHEIRTPINAIVGMTAIGRAAGAVERKDYCFMKIDDASRHLLGVISDILDMSKIEASKIELSPTEFNFEKLLQQAVDVINFRMDEKHQKLSVSIDKNIPKMMIADDQRLAQVVTNLLSNAVKFTPEKGNIGLTARLLGEEDGWYTIEVQVQDSGIGISAEQQAKLFQSFQQAENSTTRKYGGTGLGLSIAKNIVELMGGSIRVESELGEGAAFIFTVKVKRGDDKKQAFVYNNINWGNIRILTVDDDLDVLTYFHEIVKGLGAACDVAESAEGALRLMEEQGAYNVYFVDLKMPGMDGIDMTKEIRAREKKPGNAIVIMISSADLSRVEEDARKAGVDRFLLKPIFPSSIADVISECIGMVNEKEQAEPLKIDGLFAGKHILVAEDVDINREIVMALLEPTQIEIDCAENGAEAVKLFMASPDKYSLIFMDVQMPEMDGYEASRQIRSLEVEQARHIPIVAMTANVFKEDVENCLAAGMNGHLGKPLDIDALIRVLMAYLG